MRKLTKQIDDSRMRHTESLRTLGNNGRVHYVACSKHNDCRVSTINAPRSAFRVYCCRLFPTVGLVLSPISCFLLEING